MAHRSVWFSRCVLFLGTGLVVFTACKGATGPPGLLSLGSVSGKVPVWEDSFFNSVKSPSAIPANGFTVSVVGDSTRSTTSGPDGSYAISGVPAGTYVIQYSKNPDAANGYGTMKRYNFFVGGGESFHSNSIGRKGPKPNTVSAALDSVTTGSGGSIPGIRVAWSITPPSAQFPTFAYLMTFQSPTVGATATVFGTGALSDTSIVVGLPPGTYSVAVQGDIGFGYVDETTGSTVFPARSAATFASTNVILTRPIVVDLSAKKLAKEFPGRRIVLARLTDN